MAIMVTEKAASEVKRIITQQREQNPEAPANIYLRMRVVGGGCSGFQNRLDLDPEYNQDKDMLYEFHGVPVVVDKRSLMYLNDVTVDYHNEDPMKQGFSINNPKAKGTCGCGSSYSM